uniref:Uncharacterized protein n=1 Tax=Myotis myotis TaxID=51298 RepID=A0A7J7SRE3_MYOMY|nr:hypothetical protein mMyoMyo1_009388 [Myotis myotis]
MGWRQNRPLALPCFRSSGELGCNSSSECLSRISAAPHASSATPHPCSAAPYPCNAAPHPSSATPHPCSAAPHPCSAAPQPCSAAPHPCSATLYPSSATLHPCSATPHPRKTEVGHVTRSQAPRKSREEEINHLPPTARCHLHSPTAKLRKRQHQTDSFLDFYHFLTGSCNFHPRQGSCPHLSNRLC